MPHVIKLNEGKIDKKIWNSELLPKDILKQIWLLTYCEL